jgi:cytochrome P450
MAFSGLRTTSRPGATAALTSPRDHAAWGPLPPGPSSGPVAQVLRWARSPLQFLEECGRRFGNAFTLRLAAAPPLVCFSHPDAVRDVLTADPDLLRAGETHASIAPLLGDRSLLLLDGGRHVRDRRLMLPPFHADRVHAYARTMRAVADRAIDAWPTDRAFSLHEAMQAIALDVIMETVFGPDRPAALGRVRALLIDVLALGGLPMRIGGGRGPARRWRDMVRLTAEIDGLLGAEIARRRAVGVSDGVVDLLIAARDETGAGLDDRALRDELMTLLVAGHETTAIGLAWLFHRVLSTPDLTERLRAEVTSPDTVAAERSPRATEAGGDPLPLVDAVIKETLRLNPVFLLIGRQVRGAVTVSGWTLPAGVVASPCVYLVHRHPDVWPEPARFLPDRFLTSRPSPYEYLPFGGGVRRCLGMAFSLLEMRVVAARVLERTRLAAVGAPGQPVRRGLTMAPAGGVPVALVQRD